MEYFPLVHNVKQGEILNLGSMYFAESFKLDQNRSILQLFLEKYR